MKKARLLYAGKSLNQKNILFYTYFELKEDNSIGEKWTFKKLLFRKGCIGSIYKCEIDNKTVSYDKTEIPTSLIEVDKGKFVDTFYKFPMLYKLEEETRQIDLKIKNSKKPETLLDIEIKKIKEVYKSLEPKAKASFIGNLVFKITS